MCIVQFTVLSVPQCAVCSAVQCSAVCRVVYNGENGEDSAMEASSGGTCSRDPYYTSEEAGGCIWSTFTIIGSQLLGDGAAWTAVQGEETGQGARMATGL